MKKYYQYNRADILMNFNGDEERGLSSNQVDNLLLKYGYNELTQTKKISPRQLLWSQFKDPLVVVLLSATVVSGAIGDLAGAVVIMIIVILNALIGFIQEYKAEKSIESLKSMMSLHAKVLRNGTKEEHEAKYLVPGDIVYLEEGDKIPADGYLLSINNFETSESALTGESLPVKKSLEKITKEVTIADQHTMVFSGTTVVKGFGTYIVTETGMNTQIGSIAKLMDEIEPEQSHFQKKLADLGKKIGFAVIIICICVFVSYYFLHQTELSLAFLAAVALAVAAIPEGLPAVVTIALSLGVNRMVKKNALMRKLPSVETLGSVNVICSDKTGTLTKNEMTVKDIYIDSMTIHVSGTGYDPTGTFSEKTESLEQLLKIGLLCNHASLTDENKMIGDPTEGCLIVSAKKAGYDRSSYPELHYVDEIPFDSSRKMMTSIYQNGDRYEILSKGALESILPLCTQILDRGTVRSIMEKDKILIQKHADERSHNAMRVLAFAYKINDHGDKKTSESDLVFVGLQAIIDPEREEVADAIQLCTQAGIRVIMITGDNIQTAQAIANRLHITGQAMTGNELEDLSDEQLFTCIDDYSIYARVNPVHKQRLVKMLQNKGNIVAMTGDGVNDAPALKQADIGVAMGIAGTDVSKEASDMILLDDNFTTIVNAIKEGRGIYDNIKKFVNFMLSTNLGEVLIIFVLSMIGTPIPLLAIHLLWINLVTDGLPALALGVDPIDPKIMERKPLSPKSHIITKHMVMSIIVISVIITLAVVFLFMRWYQVDLAMARTGAIILLVGLEIMRVQMIRSDYGAGILSNKWLIGALFLSLILVSIIIYTPLSVFFQTAAPSIEMWKEIAIIIGVTTIVGISIDYVLDRISAKYWNT